MTVIVPADAHQAWHATLATERIDGPVYVRLGGRTDEPPVTPVDGPFKVGKAELMQDGRDLTVIACGSLVAAALDAGKALAERGIQVRVLNMHTIKPLDRDAVLAAAAETAGIVTAEEHRLPGGLGSAVAELLAADHPTRMRFVAMPDEFSVAGPTAMVRERYGLSSTGIVEACLALGG
jgi:transketolase